MTDLDQHDFFRSDAYVADPYPYFDALRADSPVRGEAHHGVVMVTGYDEAVAVYNDPATFSSCNSVTGPFPGFPVPLEGDDVSELIEAHRDALPFSDQLPTFDPPKHKAHRGLLMRLLTPKRLRENEAFMWRRADALLDDVIRRRGCELIGELGGPFALYVIADLLGVPESEHETFREELQGGHAPKSRSIGSTSSEMQGNPLEFLYDRFTTYIEDRRRSPQPDVLTQLAQATFPDGSSPEVLDVVRVAANLFSAGQETTVRLFGTAFQLLGEDAALQERLRSDPELVANFVEECLRFESPVKGDFRLARRATTIGGVDIPAGATVMILNGAANRDARRFADPNTFDPSRPNAREHLAFGRGIHACPGGSLARAEARVLVEGLLARTSSITIDEAHHGPPGARRYRYAPTYILRGLTRLHLTFG